MQLKTEDEHCKTTHGEFTCTSDVFTDVFYVGRFLSFGKRKFFVESYSAYSTQSVFRMNVMNGKILWIIPLEPQIGFICFVVRQWIHWTEWDWIEFCARTRYTMHVSECSIVRNVINQCWTDKDEEDESHPVNIFIICVLSFVSIVNFPITYRVSVWSRIHCTPAKLERLNGFSMYSVGR